MIIHHVHNTYIQTLFALLAILTTSETFPALFPNITNYFQPASSMFSLARYDETRQLSRIREHTAWLTMM